MKKIAILASGSGSNAENIHNFFEGGSRVKVALVIYDRKDAPVAERMRARGVDTLYLPAEVWQTRPGEIVQLLKDREIDLVVLAGFLRMVPREITSAFAGRIINIHPSLLPAYSGRGMYGRRIHEAVIAAGEKKSGVTVHYVTDDIDSGEILMQRELEVSPDDTAEALEGRIHELEYAILPQAIMTALERMPVQVPPPVPAHAEVEQTAPEVETVVVEADVMPDPATQTPPPVPPARQWAERLGVNYDPSKLPPHYPGATPGETVHAAAQTPGAMGAYGMKRPVAGSDETPKMPPTYLVWSVVMTVLCCLPAGVVAIVFSAQVSSKFYAGDLEGARRCSRNAEIWIIVSFVLGVLFNTLYLPLSLLF